MAVEWGSWDYSGGNGMRVGIEVSWSSVSNSSSSVTATVDIYTQNQYSYSDEQKLTYGGAISGSTTFQNSSGAGTSVKRATKSYTYSYKSDEYGSSPGTKSFSASLSGAFNGVTPSKSVSEKIPTRPTTAPAPPSGVSVARVSDTSQKVAWSNTSTAARPWGSTTIQRAVNGGAWTTVGSGGSTSTSYTDTGTSAGNRYQYRVRSNNSKGESAWVSSSVIYTTPLVGESVTRTNGTGAQQVVSWTRRNTGHSDFNVLIERGTTPSGGTTVTWAQIASVAGTSTTYTDTAAAANTATKYRIRSQNLSGGLTSGYSNETTATPGQSAPPIAPSTLNPSALTLDPSLPIRLSWTFRPSTLTPGDTQLGFQVQHRRSGSLFWTTETRSSSTQSFDLPADTYATDQIVEWQVRTKGAHAEYSPWAAPVSFKTSVAPVDPEPVKIPVQLDLFSGKLEADVAGTDRRNLVSRFQANLLGGGVRSAVAGTGDYANTARVAWTDRFIAISLGKGDSTLRGGHHDIYCPFGWTVTHRQIVAGSGNTPPQCILTVSASTVRMRPGEIIQVRMTGNIIEGYWVVRSASSNQIAFDMPIGTAAAANATVSGATVFPNIKGHGGALDQIPNSGAVAIPRWGALYYEMPFGWGTGNTPRKNGVVRPTAVAAVAGTSITFTISDGHWFVAGDRFNVDYTVAAVPNGTELLVTSFTSTTVTAAWSGAAIASQAITNQSARLIPQGKDTFFGNFKIVYYTEDFRVPETWVLLATFVGDSNAVRWGTGDDTPLGFDSESPVFNKVIIDSTEDVSMAAGNKPPLRIGNIAGAHMRLGANKLQAMGSTSAAATLALNPDGGAITLGSGGTNLVNAPGQLRNSGVATGTFSANAHFDSANTLKKNTSSRRYKANEREMTEADVELDVLLQLAPKVYQRRDDRDPETGEVLPVTEDSPWYVGFIAEDAEALGLRNWVLYDNEGRVDSFAYDTWVAALQMIVRAQAAQLEDLQARVRRLEGQE